MAKKEIKEVPESQKNINKGLFVKYMYKCSNLEIVCKSIVKILLEDSSKIKKLEEELSITKNKISDLESHARETRNFSIQNANHFSNELTSIVNQHDEDIKYTARILILFGVALVLCAFAIAFL